MFNQCIYTILLHSGKYMTIKEIVNEINAVFIGVYVTYHQVYKTLEKYPYLYDKIIINRHCHKYGLV